MTGATGLIGGGLVRELHGHGWEVVALARPSSVRGSIDALITEWREGDVTDAASLAGTMAGCDVVFHAAGLTGPGHPTRDYFRLNAGAVENVLTEAVRAGVGRMVHVSSVAAYRAPQSGTVDEDMPLGPKAEAYGEAKAEAEAMCTAVTRDTGLSVRIVRPTIVYGEGERGFVPLLCDMLVQRKFRFFGRGDHPIHLVHARDVAAGMIACAESDAAHGRAYNLDGGEAITWRAFVEQVCKHLGLEVPGSIPVGIALAVGSACEALVRLRVLGGAPLSRALVRAMVADVEFSCARAEQELGWGPRVPLSQGLPAALASCRPRTDP